MGTKKGISIRILNKELKQTAGPMPPEMLKSIQALYSEQVVQKYVEAYQPTKNIAHTLIRALIGEVMTEPPESELLVAGVGAFNAVVVASITDLEVLEKYSQTLKQLGNSVNEQILKILTDSTE